jgi:hypothetical protein
MDPPTPTRLSKNLRAHVESFSPLTSPQTSQRPSSPLSSPPNVLSKITDIFEDINDWEEEEEDVFVSSEGRGEYHDVLGATLNELYYTAPRIQNKLRVVFKVLREVRWSISQFLEVYIRETDSKGRAIIGDISRTLTER